jgi:hypothetical protein
MILTKPIRQTTMLRIICIYDSVATKSI